MMFKRKKRVNKGAPSGLVISLVVHAGIFFAAGLFVVFKVIPAPKPVFEAPPPVERRRMKLKKPKVRIKKSSTPKPASRIVAKVELAKMPEIAIPDLRGTGDGLLGGLGGQGGGALMGLPDFSDITIFGGQASTGFDLKGTYYDLNRTRSGNVNGIEPTSEIGKVVTKFIQTGCNKSVVANYYQSPPLYAVGVMVPRILSAAGPVAFGQDPDVARPQGWFVHYEGKLVHPTDIRFRFWGNGDDILVVMVDRKVVLHAGVSYRSPEWVGDYELTPGWTQKGTTMYNLNLGRSGAGWGDWIDLKGGEVHDLDIIIGESPGGAFYAMLNVEVDGVEYEKNQIGAPIFPMFKTDDLSWAQQDAIYQYLIPGESSLTNGPVFRDY